MRLENGTVLEVGKKYEHGTRIADIIYECLYIGQERWFYRDQDGVEMLNDIDDDWLPYEEEMIKDLKKG